MCAATATWETHRDKRQWLEIEICFARKVIRFDSSCTFEIIDIKPLYRNWIRRASDSVHKSVECCTIAHIESSHQLVAET